jgi:hypothetical protein
VSERRDCEPILDTALSIRHKISVGMMRGIFSAAQHTMARRTASTRRVGHGLSAGCNFENDAVDKRTRLPCRKRSIATPA